MEKDCEVCQILQTPLVKLLKTKYWQLSLGEDQTYLGRSYLTLLTHKSSLSELSDEEWSDYVDLVKRIEPALRDSFGAHPINWSCLMNNAYLVNPPLAHVHWHIIPRYNKTIEFGGEIFEDKRYGHSPGMSNEGGKTVSSDTMELIANKIRESLGKDE